MENTDKTHGDTWLSWIGRDRKFRHAYHNLAIAGLLVAIIGFSSTYFIPMVSKGEPFATAMHIHGAFCFSWLIIFVTQSLFVKKRQIKQHRMLGILGIFIAVGVVISMQLVGYHMVTVGMDDGLGDRAFNFIPGPVFDSMLFASLVTAAIFWRHKRDYHGRFLLLATILILWVAWSRWRHYFPEFPNREVLFAFWIAMAPIPALWWYEWKKSGVIHPAMFWGGLLVILQQAAQVLSNDAFWQASGKLFYGFWSSIV